MFSRRRRRRACGKRFTEASTSSAFGAFREEPKPFQSVLASEENVRWRQPPLAEKRVAARGRSDARGGRPPAVGSRRSCVRPYLGALRGVKAAEGFFPPSSRTVHARRVRSINGLQDCRGRVAARDGSCFHGLPHPCGKLCPDGGATMSDVSEAMQSACVV